MMQKLRRRLSGEDGEGDADAVRGSGAGAGAGAGAGVGIGGGAVARAPPKKVTATTEHCAHCFDTLVGSLRRARAPAATFDVDHEFPFFVTWNIVDRRHGEVLRGCIGTLSAQPLSKLQEYALTSAFRDRRFDPIEAHEVPSLVCRVSLLVDYEEGRDWMDWEVGKHGIIIDFDGPRGHRYNATYLPEVASEQGWDQQTAIDSLVRKAGYKDRVTSSLRKSIRLTRYQSSKARQSFDEYCAHRGLEPKDVLVRA